MADNHTRVELAAFPVPLACPCLKQALADQEPVADRPRHELHCVAAVASAAVASDTVPFAAAVAFAADTEPGTVPDELVVVQVEVPALPCRSVGCSPI